MQVKRRGFLEKIVGAQEKTAQFEVALRSLILDQCALLLRSGIR